MAGRFTRPKNREEVVSLEAKGLWKAQAFSKRIAESKEKISLKTILDLHGVFIGNVNPDIAGRFRKNGEDVNKLKNIEPPPGRLVNDRMYEFWKEFDTRIAKIPKHPKKDGRSQKREWLNQVLDLAVWTQYQITVIHPFCEGNGRMARMMTNVVLRRFNLQPSNIHHEGVNRDKYIDALGAIDNYGNFDLLKELVLNSVKETYDKVYAVAKKARIEKRKRE